MAKTLRVGLIGYRFMGRAHSNAWRQAPGFFHLKANVELHTLCGRNTAGVQPYVGHWLLPGHLIGYEHTFVHTVADFVNACVEGKPVSPTFEDGLKNQRVLAAVEESAQKGRWVKL